MMSRYVKEFKVNFTGSTAYVPLTEAIRVVDWKLDTPVKVSIPENEDKIIIEKVRKK